MRQWLNYEKNAQIEKREAQNEDKDKAFDLAQEDLQEIFKQILLKAELLLKLNVPDKFLVNKQNPLIRSLSQLSNQQMVVLGAKIDSGVFKKDEWQKKMKDLREK